MTHETLSVRKKGDPWKISDYDSLRRFVNDSVDGAPGALDGVLYGTAGSSIPAYRIVSPTFSGTESAGRDETAKFQVGAPVEFRSFTYFTTAQSSGTEFPLTPICDGKVYKFEADTSVDYFIGAPCGPIVGDTKIRSGLGGFVCLTQPWTEDSKSYILALASHHATRVGFRLTAIASSGLINCELADAAGSVYDANLTSQVYNWQGLLTSPNVAQIGYTGMAQWFGSRWIFDQSYCVPVVP